MTDLHQLGHLALKMARESLKRTRDAGFVCVFVYPDGSLFQLPPETAGILAHGMNDGELKDLIFGTIRAYREKTGASAVVIATECWRGRSTEAAAGIPREEIRRLGSEHRFETLVQMGMVEREEAIVATAQDAERCVLVSQVFRRQDDGTVYSYGEVESHEVPQSQFEGRQKMFGDLSPEKLHEHRYHRTAGER